MKRCTLLAATLIFLAYATSTAFAQAPPTDAQTPAAPAHEHHAMPRPTNLQVLPKDISQEDLMKVMHGFTGALGVHCSFCHEVNKQTHKPDFASDAKPDKGFARIMILMTRDINAKYIAQVHDPDATPEQRLVTCGTCHRGMMMPEPFVPKPESHKPESK